ncbi:hypothetical protein KI387_039252, partial [Taxus chinensis]
KMVRTGGVVANNAPPEGGAATTQKLDEILAALLDTRDHLNRLYLKTVMGNEEDEEAGDNNQQPPEDNPDVG